MRSTQFARAGPLTVSFTKTEEGGRRLGALARPAVGWDKRWALDSTPSNSNTASGVASDTLCSPSLLAFSVGMDTATVGSAETASRAGVELTLPNLLESRDVNEEADAPNEAAGLPAAVGLATDGGGGFGLGGGATALKEDWRLPILDDDAGAFFSVIRLSLLLILF